MEKWNITPNDPGEFTLAADARCTHTNYVNDHIWELRYQNVEPPALTVQTSYGLRARSFRIFPRFVESEEAFVDPLTFDTPPAIHNFGPSFLSTSYYPVPGILVEAHYHVPESNVMGGVIKITNKKLKDRELRFELAAFLTPDEIGHRMAAKRIDEVMVLTGQTHHLHPVLFITGGAQAGTGAFSSLDFDLDLAPGTGRTFSWAVAAEEDELSSLRLAREAANRSWEAEIAQGELLAKSTITIKTGDQDWDTALALSQKTALGLLMSPTPDFPGTSFVVNRLPEQGFSAQGDGQDYQLNWSGQTPLQADYLSGLIINSAPEFAQELLQNFLAFQSPDGFIPKKVGLAGQKSNLLAMPLLGNMAWRIYTSSGSEDFLEEVYPKLKAFVEAWLTPGQDSDEDGIPEWVRARQSGFEAHPANITNPNWVLHPEVSMTEEPALCALLSHELKLLIQMAVILGEESDIESLEALRAILENAIQESWDEEEAIYYRWDKDTHFSPAGETLVSGTGNGPLIIQRTFDHPVRLLIQLETANTLSTKVTVFLHGYEIYDEGGLGKHRVERVSPSRFQWHLETGKAMSLHTYSSLEYVDVFGLGKDDKVTIHIADYRTEDISLLLPLWSGDAGQEQAQNLIEKTITNSEKFWFPFGLRSTPHAENPSVLMPWNTFIGKGLIAYDRRDLAAKLVSKLMKAVIKNLKEKGRFFTCYEAGTGQGLQEHNTVDGLAPLELFLETLGVKILSPRKFALVGQNPFPWPVTITYRGTSIVRRKRKTTITFPDGQRTVVKDPKAQIISLE